MPATNEEFIKKAFEAGLSEEQVRQAVSERNQKMGVLPDVAKSWGERVGGGLPGMAVDVLTGPAQKYANLSGKYIQKGPGMLQETLQNPQEAYKKYGSELQQDVKTLGDLPSDTINQTATLASAVELPKSIVKGGVDLVKNIQGAKSINPLKVSNYVESQLSGKSPVTVNGDDIVKHLKSQTYPVGTGEKVADIIAEAEQRFGGKTFTMDQIRNEMGTAGDAFTALGRIGKSAGAKVNSNIYGFLRNKIGEQAPEISKEIGKQAFMHKAPQMIRKAFWPVTTAAGALYGFNTIKDALTGRMNGG